MTVGVSERPGQETPRPGRSPPNALYPWGKKQEGAAISTKGGRQGSTGGNPMKKCLQGLELAVAAGVDLGGGGAAARGQDIGLIPTQQAGGRGPRNNRRSAASRDHTQA